MVKKILFVSFLSVYALTVSAQSEKQGVQSAIESFFKGMHTADSSLIRQVTFKETTLQTVLVAPTDGKASVRSTPFEDFIKQIGTPMPNRKIEERISSYVIQHDGPMATAWTTYTFWVNDSFSHCGVNTFTLIKSPSGWKIWSILDTRRKADCP